MFEVCALEMCEMFVYKNLEAIEYVIKISLPFKKFTNFARK